MSDYKYLNQGKLGELFGATSHQVGKWLEEIGLKENKRPSWVAHHEGFVEPAPTGRALDSFYYVWDKRKTVNALVEAGHKLVAAEEAVEPSISLTGPFESRPSSEDGYEIVGGDGMVAVWVRGEGNAEFIADLLNLAARHGKLPGDSRFNSAGMN